MAYTKVEIHPFNFESRLERFKSQCIQKDYKPIMDFLKALARGEVTGKVVTKKRQRKLIDMFLIYYKNSNKSISQLTYEDLQKFKDRLLNDSINKDNNKPYSLHTKEDITETLVRFIEWNNPKKASNLSSRTMSFRKWFIIKSKNTTPETLSEAEIDKLYKSCKSIEGKFIISVLFDSGARIEEFLNLRFEDFEEPTANNPYWRIDFKEEYSKTDGRKIGMYWKHSTEAITKFLKACEKKDMKERVFDKKYDAVRMFLFRLGKKVLNKRVHPHIFRKSSATYYADKLNRQQFCIRYGWKFSSDMPDVYIRRAGVDEEKVKDIMLNDDISKLRAENQEIKVENRKIKDQFNDLLTKFHDFVDKFDKLRRGAG